MTDTHEKGNARQVPSDCSSQMNVSSVSKKDALLQINLIECAVVTPENSTL
jgi:hypothetical protein